MNTQPSEARRITVLTADLIRWSKLAAMAAGVLFVAIQPVHPPDVLVSVATMVWALVHYSTIA